jgi:hypothetical protein
MESNKKQIKFTNVPKTTSKVTTSKVTTTSKVNTNTASKVTTKTTTTSNPKSTSKATTTSKVPFQHTFDPTGDQFQKSANAMKNIIDAYGDLDC